MLLRPRQQTFVDRCGAALAQHSNTLGVAPTGAGKTVMLSAVTGALISAGADRALVLQHRDELVAQNRKTYHAFNKTVDSGVVDASSREFNRQVVFAMVQTLSRDAGLAAMRPVSVLVVDEAHHSAAPSYQKIIDRARALNQAVKLLGVTATPNRGDKKALRGIFDNVADQISLGELIATGALVRPRTFVIDIGVREELSHVRKNVTDFDMNEVGKIMDKEILNDQIVRHWQEKAGDRQTIIFASTVEHAGHVLDAFRHADIPSAVVFGDMPEFDRRNILAAFDRGEIRVVVNVAVLTEGYDCQPVSCVVLLRPSSYKSTMIQMVGRGLRRIDPERYQHVVKNDCIVLDFGTSTLIHGSLEQDVNLDGREKGDAPKRTCPECQAEVPIAAPECAICGYVFPITGAGEGGEDAAPQPLGDFIMTEVDLFSASPFKWEDIFSDGSVLIASAFDAWAMTVFYNGNWHAIGGAAPPNGVGITHLAVGDRLICLSAADDFMRNYGDSESAAKSKRWLHMPATEKQLQALRLPREAGIAMTRYMAACKLTWQFNQSGVKAKLFQVGGRAAA